MRVSLAIRFILFTSLLVLTTSLTLSLFFLSYHESEEEEEMRRQGLSLARNLAHNAELGALTRNADLLRELGRGLLQDTDVVGVAVVDADGSPLMEEHRAGAFSRPVAPLPTVSRITVRGGEARIAALASAGGKQTISYECSYPILTLRETRANEELGFLIAEPLADQRLERIGEARVILSLAETHRSVAGLKRAFLMLTGAVILLATLLTILMVRRMVGPLRDLAEATRRIAGGSLDEVVRESSHDELGQLARSFNLMTAELRRSRRDLEQYSASLEDQVRARTRELEEAQSQLVQAEKMSAVGLLVSGVAHELNNPLAGVVGYAQLLLKSDADERVRRGLEKINREAERCKKIVQNLQTFARKHKPQKDYLGVNGILESTLELRSYQMKVDNITVVADLDASLPKTMADFHQLQQVFLNIIINAHQAMASRGAPGVMTLRSRREGERIVVEFEDNGPGVAEENLGKVFDPFFTTKEVGQGTGLGLAICYGIIQEHKGSISVRNASAGGAVFRVELPISDPDSTGDGLPLPVPDPDPVATPRRNILVVDDELAIIDILYQVLRMDGHRVDTALNGTVALRKIEKEQYDLIISDLKMPGMGGKELYQKVRELDDDLARRIIFSTGDVVSADTREFLDGISNSYLQKPFEIDTIRRVVHSVLNTTAR